MKTLFFSIVFVLFAFAFTSCNDDFETPSENVSSANASAVQVKVSATTSPYLKNGEDDDDPVPMFCISGFVTENGTPVAAEVQLVATPANSLVDSTTTDSNGGFEFYQVPPGSYNVVVVVDGGVAKTIEVNL
jgi:hypothetical protein